MKKLQESNIIKRVASSTRKNWKFSKDNELIGLKGNI